MNLTRDEMKYLRLLSNSYGTIGEAAAEIINLTAIQNLPKGTEYFFSDIHGEYEAFRHILRNASGTIRRKIDESFPEMSPEDRRSLATLIYYPEDKLKIIKKNKTAGELNALYRETINDLLIVLETISFKNTRSYVRKRLPKDFAYIFEELLFGNKDGYQDFNYRQTVIDSIIEIDQAEPFIIALCKLIPDLSIFRLHIIGDLFDRGPGGDIVAKTLMKYHNVDIQWGNHDILWMGAAAGNKACIANVVRICTRYDNLHTLEVGYGISLRPLVTFAMETYRKDPCSAFKTNVSIDDAMHDTDIASLKKIGKAIAIMQFKLEGQLIEKHPHYEMNVLRLLDKIDYEKGTITIEGKVYEMSDTNFPTIDPADPYRLTEEEDAVMERLRSAFLESAELQRHIRFLFSKGNLYKVVNGNLLFHGCVPMTEDGRFDFIDTYDGPKDGKEWFDYAERMVRTGYFGHHNDPNKERGVDFFWYLWCGYKSPLFGKKKITTFERLFIDDESTWKEEKNPYYKIIDDEEVVLKILREFGCNDKYSCIINGHIPVKKGTSPVHANGRLFFIDGGFAKAYQKTTGIAGYSLVQNSYGFILSAHERFESKAQAIAEEKDILFQQVAREDVDGRMLIKDTDDGKAMQEKIEGLKMLVHAYRTGLINQSVEQ